MNNAQGHGLFPLELWIFDTVSFEFSGEALVPADVNLGVGGGGGVMGSDSPSSRWFAVI